jgi:hypothetical protein
VPASSSGPRRYPRVMRGPLLIFACVIACLAPASPALATTSGLSKGLPPLSVTAATDTAAVSAAATAHPPNPNAPIPIALSNKVPAGRRLSPDQVLAIANKLPKMRAVRRNYPGSYGGVYLKLPFRWQVSYFSRGGGKEIGQVIISDLGGRVLEQWTGFQVAWTMARGYPGAFGEHVNALYVWLPMCLLFILPFLDFRRPFSLLHLDLLVLLSFSVSLAFFNHAHIYASVPLAYPPLLYMLARMLALLRRRRRGGPGSSGGPPLRLLVPTPWLAVGIVFLLGFRIGLNVTDSNVIDVGYAGVIGAQRIATDRPLYGSFPTDNEHGDTYGPFNYEAYVPFQQIFGWSGSWDDLPAAHAAAIVFDLLAIGLLFLIGRRMRGPTLGIALAYAWVSYPFTLFALESNTNDTLVAVLTLFALLAASYRSKLAPMARGVFAALAGLTKLAPLALAPILATHGLWELSPLRRARAFALYLLGFAAAVALASIPALSHDSLHQIYERTLVYQANRGSPFSVWGLYNLHLEEQIVEIATVVLVLALAVLPRRSDLLGLAAACAAAMIAVQLGMEHWFYLYIPWFFALAIVVLLGRFSDPGSRPMLAAPSAPARSTLPEAALST